MRPRRAALAAAALALAGCAGPGLPLTGTVGVPAQPGMAAQGQAEVVVRTFTEVDGARAEVGGAVCRVNSILFKAELKSPGRLVFPGFGPQSPTLDVVCRAGALSGRATQGVVTQWVSAPGVGPGPGPWGGPWGPWGYGGWGGWGGWNGPSFPTFVYPEIAVTLRGPAAGGGQGAGGRAGGGQAAGG